MLWFPVEFVERNRRPLHMILTRAQRIIDLIQAIHHATLLFLSSINFSTELCGEIHYNYAYVWLISYIIKVINNSKLKLLF